MEKKVSVVMCTYNGAKYIREQLDSILNQTYPIFEIIIQDDCSTDDTVEILNDFKQSIQLKKNIEVHVYVNEKNIGYNRNFLSAFMRAKGEFIACSDQDDIWYPEKIEKQINSIGSKDVCCSFYEEGEHMTDSKNKLLSPWVNPEHILFTNTIPGHTMLLRRSFFQNMRPWGDEVIYDWWIAISAALGNGIAIVSQSLSWHRRHNDSVIQSIFNKKANIKRQSWHPYIFGIYAYRRLQEKESFQLFYQYVSQLSRKNQYELSNKLSQLLLRTNSCSLFSLCCLCFKHRKQIYPIPLSQMNGGMFSIRSFFYPFIFAFSNTSFS